MNRRRLLDDVTLEVKLNTYGVAVMNCNKQHSL